MSHYTPTNDQIQALVQFASAKLGVAPEQLITAVQSGQVSKLGDSISSTDAKKLQSFMNSKQAESFLQSPAVQQYIQNFFHQNQ